MGRTTQSNCFKKHKFVIPQSYQPVVRLNRIVLPENVTDSLAIESKNDKFETAEITNNNVYNLRRSGKKNNCKKCGKKFESLSECFVFRYFKYKTIILMILFTEFLKIHMKHHANNKTFKCRMCNYATDLKGNLSRHVKIHVKEEIMTRTQSNNSKSRARSQMNNKNYHENDKNLTCSDCNELFNCQKLLTEHCDNFHKSQFKNNKYSCSLCSRTFRYYGRFSRHLRNFHNAGSSVQSKIN